MAQVTIAWSLSKSFISAPIVGTTSIDKLKDLVGMWDARFLPLFQVLIFDLDRIGGIHLKLTEEEVKSIDEPYQPRPIAGHM